MRKLVVYLRMKKGKKKELNLFLGTRVVSLFLFWLDLKTLKKKILSLVCALIWRRKCRTRQHLSAGCLEDPLMRLFYIPIVTHTIIVRPLFFVCFFQLLLNKNRRCNKSALHCGILAQCESCWHHPASQWSVAHYSRTNVNWILLLLSYLYGYRVHTDCVCIFNWICWSTTFPICAAFFTACERPIQIDRCILNYLFLSIC